MKKNLSATSIIESMVVLLIIMIAITGAYEMFVKSIHVTESSDHKLQAISMAKEGIEAVTNIRDTNWKVLPGDYNNCWNTLNYNTSCYNSNNTTYDIQDATSYILWKDPVDFRWKLASRTTGLYSNPTYRSNFRVGFDSDGFYTQSGGLITQNIFPEFTREIRITYLEDFINGSTHSDSDEQKMLVTSLVQWTDNSSDDIKTVELETILTNWKNNEN